jgi:Ribonuclease G/E
VEIWNAAPRPARTGGGRQPTNHVGERDEVAPFREVAVDGGWMAATVASRREGAPSSETGSRRDLEQFQQKWKPVLRQELCLNKDIEHFR